MLDWILKDTQLYNVTESHFKHNDTDNYKEKDGKKHHANTNQKKVSGYIHIWQNRPQNEEIISNKVGYYAMMNDSTHQEDITTLSVYIPNKKLSKYVKQSWQNWRKKQIHEYGWRLQTFFLVIDSKNRQKKKITKNIEDWNSTTTNLAKWTFIEYPI